MTKVKKLQEKHTQKITEVIKNNKRIREGYSNYK